MMTSSVQERYARLRAWLEKYRRYVPTAALLLGLVWDSLTLGRPDQLFDNLVLLFYLLVAGAGILVLQHHQERGNYKHALVLTALIQFSFGNLTSGLFILYSISGTLAGNWVFFLLLVGFLVGNELLRDRYHLLPFNVSAYYLLLFAYFVLIAPILLGEFGVGAFVIGGIAGLAAITFFLSIVRAVARGTFEAVKGKTFASVIAIFVVFNVLYFSNLIPPVPLALRDIDIYHHVSRTGERYLVAYEKPAWYEFWKDSDNGTFHMEAGNTAYCFSSVFAPGDLTVPIYHRWEYFNPSLDEWQTTTRISFPIVGGRAEGYRGFSLKSALEPGTWRCNVETQRGALIGRETFRIERGGAGIELVSDVR